MWHHTAHRHLTITTSCQRPGHAMGEEANVLPLVVELDPVSAHRQVRSGLGIAGSWCELDGHRHSRLNDPEQTRHALRVRWVDQVIVEMEEVGDAHAIPLGLEHHGITQITLEERGRTGIRTDREMTMLFGPQELGEDAGGVSVWCTHPGDRSIGLDECQRLEIGQEAVTLDRLCAIVARPRRAIRHHLG